MGGCWVGLGGGWMVVWYPANHQTHPATPRQPPCNTQKPTSVCVHTSFGACVHVSGFLKFLPRPQATSPHSPMHPETPIDPFTWKERPTPTGQIETSIESKLSVCQKSFSYVQKGEQQIFYLAYYKRFYCFFEGSYGLHQQILHI